MRTVFPLLRRPSLNPQKHMNTPVGRWQNGNTAIRDHRQPATPTIGPDIAQQRGNALSKWGRLPCVVRREAFPISPLCTPAARSRCIGDVVRRPR